MLTKLRKIVSILPTSTDAYAALREFYKDEVMRMLHEIPVESLSRNKGGIRVALLRDSGYKSMKQIYELDYFELHAINGIGPQNAKRILAESSRIAKEVRATIVAKPNFTQNATGKKVIQEYCRYKWTAKVHASIEDILASEEKLIDEYCSMVTPASGALRWTFTFSRKKKDSALQAAAVLQKRVKSTTEELVNAAENLYAHCSEISFEDAWRDYMKSTDEYNRWITKNSIPEA